MQLGGERELEALAVVGFSVLIYLVEIVVGGFEELASFRKAQEDAAMKLREGIERLAFLCQRAQGGQTVLADHAWPGSAFLDLRIPNGDDSHGAVLGGGLRLEVSGRVVGALGRFPLGGRAGKDGDDLVLHVNAFVVIVIQFRSGDAETGEYDRAFGGSVGTE